MRNGKWTSGDVWGGVKEGMVKVEHFGPKLPKAVREEVLARQQEMAAGKLQPFRAVQADIRDNQAQVRIPKGAQLSDAQLLQMDWLAEGVVGSIR